MRLIITDSYERTGLKSANIVSLQISPKPDNVLGLATGSTPMSLYRWLRAMHETVEPDFSSVTTLNL